MDLRQQSTRLKIATYCNSPWAGAVTKLCGGVRRPARTMERDYMPYLRKITDAVRVGCGGSARRPGQQRLDLAPSRTGLACLLKDKINQLARVWVFGSLRRCHTGPRRTVAR
jgi:hypothetical protein